MSCFILWKLIKAIEYEDKRFYGGKMQINQAGLKAQMYDFNKNEWIIPEYVVKK